MVCLCGIHYVFCRVTKGLLDLLDLLALMETMDCLARQDLMYVLMNVLADSASERSEQVKHN